MLVYVTAIAGKENKDEFEPYYYDYSEQIEKENLYYTTSIVSSPTLKIDYSNYYFEEYIEEKYVEEEQNKEEIYLGSGKASWFGGPNEASRELNMKLALYPNKHLRDLNHNDYYCAMRWDYSIFSQQLLTNSDIIVKYNNKEIIVKPVDWGPSKRTGRIIDLSPGAMQELGIATDVHDVDVYLVKN